MTATIASRTTELPKSGWNMMRASIGDEDDDDRAEGVLRLVDSLHAPLEHRRREQDDRELGELGRLDAHAGHGKPAVGPVDLRADDQDGHQREQRDSRRSPRTRRGSR